MTAAYPTALLPNILTVVACGLLCGCSAAEQSPDEHLGGSIGSAGGGSASEENPSETSPSTVNDNSGGASFEAAPSSASGGAEALNPYGTVDFVAFYEEGSAWIDNAAAQAMVESVFADFEGTLRTSGDFNATIEVYFTDDNPDYANTFFSTNLVDVKWQGQTLYAVGPWSEIVLGQADLNGPADNAGNGYDFAISFNVATQSTNKGLLRHEMMHGLGAVTAVSYFSMSDSDVLAPAVGEKKRLSIYDTLLVDRDGAAVWDNYDSVNFTFELQALNIDQSKTAWTDGEAGMFLRGIGDTGTPFDMTLSTAPSGALAVIRTNEPRELMSSGYHPTWNTIAEPDRAFFRAMGYSIY